MANERILVVDDEPHIRFLCEEILTRHGYLPTSTQNARAALDAASNKSFDLLMTDISMPDMDGLQLLRSIREHQADLPAIIITGRGRLDDAIRSLRMGAQGFILKPFTQQVLLQSIQETLAKTYLTKENLRLKLLMPLFEISQDLLMETNPTALFEQIVRVASMETKSDQAVLLAKDDRTSTFEINASLPIITGSEALREINRKLGSKTVEKKAPLIHLEGEARSGGEGEISSDD
ncbi:MAG: response regulator, partial [Nitrospiria bacterium]